MFRLHITIEPYQLWSLSMLPTTEYEQPFHTTILVDLKKLLLISQDG